MHASLCEDCSMHGSAGTIGTLCMPTVLLFCTFMPCLLPPWKRIQLKKVMIFMFPSTVTSEGSRRQSSMLAT